MLTIDQQIRKRKQKDNVSFMPEEHVFFPQSTAFIFGGGPSLKDFDVSLLRHKFVIGCNDAYLLGADLVNVVVFADWVWYEKHQLSIQHTYEGPLISTNGRARGEARTRYIKRIPEGLHREEGVGWNLSTGAMAVNVALRFGARRIILLGIDMRRDNRGDQNWHPNPLSSPPDSSYLKYMDGFKTIYKELPRVYPGAQIINANMESRVEYFPKMPREEALACF